MVENRDSNVLKEDLLNLLNTTKKFPKTHLVAASICLVTLAGVLSFIPNEEVVAEKQSSNKAAPTNEQKPDSRKQVVLRAPDSSGASNLVSDQLSSSHITKSSSADLDSLKTQSGEQELVDNKEPPIKTQEAIAAKTTSTDTSATSVQPTVPEENWLRIKVRSGDNLTTLFKKAGLGANQMYPLINGIKPAKPFKPFNARTAPRIPDRRRCSQ